MPDTIAWEWTGAYDSSKNLEYRPGARTGDEGEEYGEVDVYDQTPPIPVASFSATGLTSTQFFGLVAIHETPADETGSDYTATDPEGITYTGKIASLSGRRISGSAYWECEIKIPRPTIGGL